MNDARDCWIVVEKLGEYPDLADETVRRRIEDHLSECPACRIRVTEIEYTERLVAALPAGRAPEDLVQRIRQRISSWDRASRNGGRTP